MTVVNIAVGSSVTVLLAVSNGDYTDGIGVLLSKYRSCDFLGDSFVILY